MAAYVSSGKAQSRLPASVGRRDTIPVENMCNNAHAERPGGKRELERARADEGGGEGGGEGAFANGVHRS